MKQPLTRKERIIAGELEYCNKCGFNVKKEIIAESPRVIAVKCKDCGFTDIYPQSAMQETSIPTVPCKSCNTQIEQTPENTCVVHDFSFCSTNCFLEWAKQQPIKEQ